MVRWIDEFAGDYLFRPPIIRLCQAIGWSQYRLASILRVVGLSAIWSSNFLEAWNAFNKGEWIFGAVLFGVTLYITMPTFWCGAVLLFNPELKRPPDARYLRIMALSMSSLFGVIFLLDSSAVYLFGVLFVMTTEMYAVTIPEIPPPEARGVPAHNSA